MPWYLPPDPPAIVRQAEQQQIHEQKDWAEAQAAEIRGNIDRASREAAEQATADVEQTGQSK